MPVRFFEQNIKAGLKNKRKLSAFIDGLIKSHLKNAKTSLNYIFCADEFLLQINQQYLNHDTFTDTITFDLSETKDELIGEIYISIERVKENAQKFNVTYMDELHRVIFHGALHLCGYKDKNESDRLLMREKENLAIREFFNSAI